MSDRVVAVGAFVQSVKDGPFATEIVRCDDPCSAKWRIVLHRRDLSPMIELLKLVKGVKTSTHLLKTAVESTEDLIHGSESIRLLPALDDNDTWSAQLAHDVRVMGVCLEAHSTSTTILQLHRRVDRPCHQTTPLVAMLTCARMSGREAFPMATDHPCFGTKHCPSFVGFDFYDDDCILMVHSLCEAAEERHCVVSLGVVLRKIGWARCRHLLRLRAIVLFWLDLTKHLMDVVDAKQTARKRDRAMFERECGSILFN